LVFYDFLRILQESAKWLYYLRFTFAAGAWKVSGSYKYALTLRISPQKESVPCNWVLGGAAGGNPVEFRRARRRTWPGKPRGGPRGHTEAIWAGRKVGAAPAGGVRRSGSGELSAGAREWVARTALLGSREDAGGVGRQWVRAERRLYCGGAHGMVAGSAACEGRVGGHLNSRGGFSPSRRSKDPRLTQLYGAQGQGVIVGPAVRRVPVRPA
jgi:hypothetical protein